MEPLRFSADERGALCTVASLLARHGISFEDATNRLLEQPIPVDGVLRAPAQHRLELQAAATRTGSMSYSGKDSPNTFFQAIQEQPGSASHILETTSGFLFGDSMTNEINQPGREHFFSQPSFAEFPAVNFHNEAPSSASAICLSPLPEHSGLVQVYLPQQPSTEICGISSRWSNEVSIPVSNSAAEILSAPNGINYVGDYSILDQHIHESRYMPHSRPTVSNQHAVSYLEYGMNETSHFTLAPNRPTLSFPTCHNSQELVHSRSSQTSRNKKREHDKTTSANDIAGPNLRRKKRRPFANRTQKEQTARVRDIGACLRCQIQRIRCTINNNDPEGICSRCQNLGRTMSNLPCLRVKFMDSILFRKIVDPSSGRPGFSIHFNTGVEKPVTRWNTVETRTINLIPGFDSILRLRVHKATAFNLTGVKASQHFMYQCPWALVDFKEAVNDVEKFITASIKPAVKSKVSREDKLTRAIFCFAFEIVYRKAEPSQLLKDVLELWTASRCIEGGWRFSGSETLDLPADKKGTTPLTHAAIIDTELSSIFALHFLEPLRNRVLERIHKKSFDSESRKSHWLELFLANFILQHNFGYVMIQQRKWARENNSKYRYTKPMMELVTGILSSSKVILWYFHYALKGQFPFQENWKSNSGPKIAELNEGQHNFVRFIAGEVEKKAATWRELHESSEYETPGWFTGQLFDPNWQPPETIEEAPLAP